LKAVEIKKKIFDIIEPLDNSDLKGKAVDLALVFLIIINMVLVIADTFPIPDRLRFIFYIIEIISVVIFTIEYILRFWTSDLIYPDKSKAMARIMYSFTFLALIDLFAILPFYIPVIIPLDLRILRTLRILRLVRLFKVNRYTSTFSAIIAVFKKKFSQLLSSVFIVFLLMIIVSVLMFNVEHDAQPGKFTNAFSSFWWAIATLTTIGYGDIYPITAVGQLLNGIFAFLGIGLVAIPTGIISAGFVEQARDDKSESEEKHDEKCFCPYCGKKLDK